MSMDRILSRDEGKKLFLLGNEGIARGALEAGIGLAATYPGTPSSEIGNVLSRIAKDAGIYFEFSVNEKVAVEVAAAASACGVRSLTFMKHVGLNVAADPFMTIAYTGVRGGFVLVSADDPSCHSSQNEQDNRYYGQISGAPIIEPSTPQECKDMTRIGFDLSEKFELPFILRTTTRVSHMRAPVSIGPLRGPKAEGRFEKDPERFVVLPAHARKRHAVLLEQLAKLQEFSEKSELNRFEGSRDSKLGVLTAGAAYNYTAEVIHASGLGHRLLKLGLPHPFPAKLVREFIEPLDTLIVSEELEPIMETQALALAKDANPKLKVIGKGSGHFPRLYEYSPDTMASALDKALGTKLAKPVATPKEMKLPNRPPVLCPGCPHRSTYYAARKALNKRDSVYSTDIGCYTLGIQPPMLAADFLLCMGSSVDAACGFSKATDQLILAFIGDSTFFHSGIHGMINAVYNGDRFVYTILDNRTTAMTGHQPNPGMGVNGMGEPSPEADIEGIAKACGVKWLRTIDPSETKDAIEAYKEALDYQGVAVIVSRRACVLLEARDRKKAGSFRQFHVKPDDCRFCLTCIKQYGCPALVKGEKKVHIDAALCNGCGVCAQVCPYKAIEEDKE
ncbi:MAG: indolepyruvate ferredoxin oxidoreductase subunit alpha [Euryarchaeota archaeon]|nr:indolepyruvate ferredoxin oxidoreductase subunit alpha [Euryarchaeota archaeon]